MLMLISMIDGGGLRGSQGVAFLSFRLFDVDVDDVDVNLDLDLDEERRGTLEASRTHLSVRGSCLVVFLSF